MEVIPVTQTKYHWQIGITVQQILSAAGWMFAFTGICIFVESYDNACYLCLSMLLILQLYIYLLITIITTAWKQSWV